MKQLKAILLIFCLSATAVSFGQSLKAKVNKAKVGLGKTIKITYSIEGDGDNFKPPTFEGFSIMSGPNQASSLSIINGQYSQNMSISYVLRSNEEGTFNFQPAQIEVDGELIASNKVKVEVVKGHVETNQKKQQQQSVYDEIADKVFVRAVSNKESVYIGEPIIVTYKVYLNTNNVRTYDIPNAPAYNGFWAQDVKIPQISLKQEKYKGKVYNVGIIKRVLLTPQKRGTLDIEPLGVEFIVRVRSGGYGFFNNFKDINVPVKSNSIDLKVRALPEKGKPINFSGAVGIFDMETSLSEKNIKTNDAVSLKIKIKGKGNIKFFDVPSIDVPQDIESYDPKLNEKIEIKNNLFEGYKSFEYLLIPRFPGIYKLDPIEFSYFDLKEHVYKVLKSPSYELKVDGDVKTSNNNAALTSTITNKDQVELIGKDIRHIQTSSSAFSKKGERYFMSYLFVIVCLTPIIGLIFLILFSNKQAKDRMNVKAMKTRKANKLAKKRLSIAKKHLDSNENEAFYDELLKALWGYFEDKLSIDRAQINKDLVIEHLRNEDVDQSIVGDLSVTIDICQFARFAPTQSGAMKQEYDKVVELITKIDQQLS